MTVVGAGGIRFTRYVANKRFKKDFAGLDRSIQDRAEKRLRELLTTPFPPGMRYES